MSVVNGAISTRQRGPHVEQRWRAARTAPISARMVRLQISAAAFAAIVATLPGNVNVENKRAPNGDVYVWLDPCDGREAPPSPRSGRLLFRRDHSSGGGGETHRRMRDRCVVMLLRVNFQRPFITVLVRIEASVRLFNICVKLSSRWFCGVVASGT
jgi:hypothetical protein